jgi:hypothetical protein
MRSKHAALMLSMFFMVVNDALSQSSSNCFLNDWYEKVISVPSSVDSTKPTVNSAVLVTISGKDTLSHVSPYMFGNAVAVWLGSDVNNTTLVPYLQTLGINPIRYPGGSWSDAFFWNGDPGDVPDSVWVSGSKTKMYVQTGAANKPTPDRYYDLRDQVGSQGLITINYAYARYGLSKNPVAQAAHYAADWVRYDNGKTLFWEIGNENANSWEYGYQIDTSLNQDGQPEIITGQLYGKHFKVFIDSMKAAAVEVGATIYIGGQLIQNSSAATGVAASWNTGFLTEAGDSADFYVIHDYYPWSIWSTSQNNVIYAKTHLNTDLSYVASQLSANGRVSKPIALTEWNYRGTDLGGSDDQKVSVINGMMAVTATGELIKNNAGLSCRWPIANWDKDGMFYYNSSPVYPLWSPRPDYFYMYYMNRFMGDVMVSSSVSSVKPTNDIFAYASRFSSGQTSVIVVNADQTYNRYVSIIPKDIGVGSKYYVYSLTAVTGSTTYPDSVAVNNYRPVGMQWGPIDSLENIRAWAYPVGDSVKIYCPARSVQYVLIDKGSVYLATSVKGTSGRQLPKNFTLSQNYPNPFNPTTQISFSLPQTCAVTLKVYDILGREVAVILQDKERDAGSFSVIFDGSKLTSGVYFYRLSAGAYNETKKMIIIK